MVRMAPTLDHSTVGSSNLNRLMRTPFLLPHLGYFPGSGTISCVWPVSPQQVIEKSLCSQNTKTWKLLVSCCLEWELCFCNRMSRHDLMSTLNMNKRQEEGMFRIFHAS